MLIRSWPAFRLAHMEPMNSIADPRWAVRLAILMAAAVALAVPGTAQGQQRRELPYKAPGGMADDAPEGHVWASCIAHLRSSNNVAIGWVFAGPWVVRGQESADIAERWMAEYRPVAAGELPAGTRIENYGCLRNKSYYNLNGYSAMRDNFNRASFHSSFVPSFAAWRRRNAARCGEYSSTGTRPAIRTNASTAALADNTIACAATSAAIVGSLSETGSGMAAGRAPGDWLLSSVRVRAAGWLFGTAARELWQRDSTNPCVVQLSADRLPAFVRAQRNPHG